MFGLVLKSLLVSGLVLESLSLLGLVLESVLESLPVLGLV